MALGRSFIIVGMLIRTRRGLHSSEHNVDRVLVLNEATGAGRARNLPSRELKRNPTRLKHGLSS
jgi:hypothetical protein